MRRTLLSLVLVLAISGFVVAESTSNIRTDFYIGALSTDSSEQNFLSNMIDWNSLTQYGIATLITLAIIMAISQKVLKHKKKINKKKFPKTKKARRKSEVYK
ncbi:MAG: hypothetical protein ABIH79_01940 [archaeon]